ncbi:hypothetical protein AGMMS49944_31910 [Spirochaetia bacterium]|nr:hypothetical protein AGMMS49944_31910 [Spirochaetia bacterium]
MREQRNEMSVFNYNTLGDGWIDLLGRVASNGKLINDELYELRHINFFIEKISENDEIIQKYANFDNIVEMKKVFFSHENNKFGHSYVDLISGPKLMKDLSDVTELLKSDIFSKKGAVVFVSSEAHVPCIQSIQFLVRDNKLETSYFARAQDAYIKLYADIIAISHLGQCIADCLDITESSLYASIVSLHIRKKDMQYAKDLLKTINRSKL